MPNADLMLRFLLAHCQIEELKVRPPRPDIVRKVLLHLPKTMEDTYSNMLENVQVDLIDEARVALVWLTFADRALTLQELCDACMIDPTSELLVDENNRVSLDSMRDSVLDLLGNLVVIESNPNLPIHKRRVGLAHATLKDYLTSDKAPPAFRLNPRDGNWFIAYSCVAYVWYYCGKLSSGHKCVPECSCVPLIHYAALQWSNHARVYNIWAPENPFEMRLRSLPSFGSLSPWLARLSSDRGAMECLTSGVFWMSSSTDGGFIKQGWKAWIKHWNCSVCLSLWIVIGRLRMTGSKIKNEIGEQGYLLHACCKAGEVECVASILEDTNIDLDVENCTGTAVQVATLYGRENVVDIFLDKVQGVQRRRSCFGQALQVASCKGNLYLVEKLLLAGADVNEPAACKFGRSLQGALKSGHEAIVRRLLCAGADPHARCSKHGSPLQAASCSGQLSTVRCIIEAGKRNVSMVRRPLGLQDGRMSPLASTFCEGDRQIAEALLASGERMTPKELSYWRDRVEWLETYGGWRTEYLRSGVCA